jgi:hypothetical protein
MLSHSFPLEVPNSMPARIVLLSYGSRRLYPTSKEVGFTLDSITTTPSKDPNLLQQLIH